MNENKRYNRNSPQKRELAFSYPMKKLKRGEEEKAEKKRSKETKKV